MRSRRAHDEARSPTVRALPGLEETLEHREQRARVRQVPAAVKPEQASLLVLRREGHSLNQIASVLYLNPGSVATLLARAEAASSKGACRPLWRTL
jgi:RNA polymerase sigma-70 factor (ECF subfamily)